MIFDDLIKNADKALNKNKIKEALKLLKDAYKINPNSFDVCAKLGILSFQTSDLKNSINYFKKTLLLNPKSSIGYSNLGIIYSKLNNLELAKLNYLKAVEVEPEKFNTNYNLANYFFSNNDTENAEKYYLRSIELDPKSFFPYNNLFQLYDRSNNLEKLEELFDNISKIFGRNSSVKFLEGILQFKKKNYKETIKIFQNLEINESDFQKNALINNIIAKCFDYVNSYSQAFKYFENSNIITQNFFKKKFNKNKFNEKINTRLKSISIFKNKLIFSQKILDTYIDPVFLIGFPRSGTTLLDTILRTHNLVEVLEEKLLVEDLIENLKPLIGGNILNLNSIDDYDLHSLRKLYFKKRTDLIGLNKKLIYIDKLPLNIIYTAELNKIFPNSKFILVLRNPHDVILSCFMQPFLPNDAMSNFYNLEDSSKFYDLVMQLWNEYEKKLNLNLHIIKYEDIVNEFDISIKKLLKFLNINWSDDLKNFHLTAQKRGIINTPSFNQVNMPIYTQSISRWKNYGYKFSELNFKLNKWINKFNY